MRAEAPKKKKKTIVPGLNTPLRELCGLSPGSGGIFAGYPQFSKVAGEKESGRGSENMPKAAKSSGSDQCPANSRKWFPGGF